MKFVKLFFLYKGDVTVTYLTTFITFRAVPSAENGICRRDIYRKLLHHYSRPGADRISTRSGHYLMRAGASDGNCQIFRNICIIHPKS